MVYRLQMVWEEERPSYADFRDNPHVIASVNAFLRRQIKPDGTRWFKYELHQGIQLIIEQTTGCTYSKGMGFSVRVLEVPWPLGSQWLVIVGGVSERS